MMKIELKAARICGGGIGSPGKANILSVTMEADFTATLAKRLGCLDETYITEGDGNRATRLRRFSYHGLKMQIPEAVATIQAGSGKARDFGARVSEFEILQKKEGIGTIRVKVSFAQKKKVEAFVLLFGEIESGADYRVTIEGAQQEMFEPPEDAAETYKDGAA
jgi:hypothetical protein